MSKKSSKTAPQQHKTPEQLKQEQELKVEANRQRKLVSEKMYPILLKCSKSVSDATSFLAVTKMAIAQAFANQKRVQTIDEIKVLNNLDPKADRASDYREFLELFRYEKILVAEQLIEGLGNAIDSFIREEMAKRSLDTIKTDFLPHDKDLGPEVAPTDGKL